MIETENLTNTNSSETESAACLSLIAGPASAKKLAEKLQENGLDCNYVKLVVEDESGVTDLTYKRIAPVLAQAQEQDCQLVITAQPKEYKLSVGVRKAQDSPFQLLSAHQLAVLLSDMLSEGAEEKSFVCVKSVVMTDMLDKMLARKGFACKEVILSSESLPEVVAATATETGASTVLAITENGEFFCNKGIEYLLEKLLTLQKSMAEQQLTLFDHLLGLYYYYGFHREKTLVVNLTQANQVAHYTKLIDSFRKAKKPQMASYSIKEIWDYQRKKLVNMESGKQQALNNEPVNLMKVVFTDGITLIMAPVEDKMYMHLSLSGKLMRKDNYSNMSRDFDQKLLKLVEVVNQL